MAQPYISIVATTRNDNHGGDLLRRTSAFINSIYYQAQKHQLPVELILVEWNPPAEKPLLHEVLPVPPVGCPVTLRFIVVPSDIHRQYKTAAAIPLYQMIAKNVGIRRAKGEFILCTNIDILFTDELFIAFSKKQLQKEHFYRANRCDIPNNVLNVNGVNNQLDYAQKNVIKRLGKTRNQETLVLPEFFYHFKHAMYLLNTCIIRLWQYTHPGQYPHFILDFRACGDFTMMHRDDWMRIEGYVELDMYSIHIDSLCLWACAAIGLKQEIFPPEACIYHIYHTDGWESDDVVKTIKFLEGKPCLDYSLVYKAGMEALQTNQPIRLNKPDWGFANHTFQEFVFTHQPTAEAQ